MLHAIVLEFGPCYNEKNGRGTREMCFFRQKRHHYFSKVFLERRNSYGFIVGPWERYINRKIENCGEESSTIQYLYALMLLCKIVIVKQSRMIADRQPNLAKYFFSSLPSFSLLSKISIVFSYFV